MEIETRKYELAHGRRPRGWGSWAFFFDGQTNIDAAFFVRQCLYREACRVARAEAKGRGARRIEVGS